MTPTITGFWNYLLQVLSITVMILATLQSSSEQVIFFAQQPFKVPYWP